MLRNIGDTLWTLTQMVGIVVGPLVLGLLACAAFVGFFFLLGHLSAA